MLLWQDRRQDEQKFVLHSLVYNEYRR